MALGGKFCSTFHLLAFTLDGFKNFLTVNWHVIRCRDAEANLIASYFDNLNDDFTVTKDDLLTELAT